jgi:hypothetical protein
VGALAAALFVLAAESAAPPSEQVKVTDALVLLAQGDAVFASTPGAPDDPPPGAELRLRRLQAGEDLRAGAFHLRAVLEGQSKNANSAYFTAMEGGRIAGPMRVTDAYVSWSPHVAFQAGVGSMRVPFSLSRQLGPAELRLPERAPIVQAVAPDFRTGAGLKGDLGALSYGAAVMAASPELARPFADGPLFALRLAAEPIGPVGLTPWRRRASDLWDAWFRFAVGVSLLHGELGGATTTSAGVDLQAQWKALVVTGEYIYAGARAAPDQQGAVVEPGVSLWYRRLDLVLRADWRRAAAVDEWGAGAALTLRAPDPRLRVQAGFERRTAAGAGNGWAIARITIALD